MNFNAALKFGKSGESEIAQWLNGRGYNVLPVYEVEIGQGKGPAVYAADGKTIIAPDLLAFRGKDFVWVEAKHKNAFTLHRITNEFVTGIDIKHYLEYQKIQSLVTIPVWMLFLHRGGQAKDSPPSPAGLYAAPLRRLMQCEHHRHENWGNSGMVYWAENVFNKLSEYPLCAIKDAITTPWGNE